MNVEEMLRELRAELQRLDRAIAAIEQLGPPPQLAVLLTPASRRGRRTMGAAERKEVSERMKQYWAKRRSKPEPGAPK